MHGVCSRVSLVTGVNAIVAVGAHPVTLLFITDLADRFSMVSTIVLSGPYRRCSGVQQGTLPVQLVLIGMALPLACVQCVFASPSTSAADKEQPSRSYQPDVAVCPANVCLNLQNLNLNMRAAL